jgi:hypothetical protein
LTDGKLILRLNANRPALLVKLTGYRLITIFVVLAIGVAKAILAYKGQLTAPTTLDWVLGVVATLGYDLFCQKYRVN